MTDTPAIDRNHPLNIWMWAGAVAWFTETQWGAEWAPDLQGEK